MVSEPSKESLETVLNRSAVVIGHEQAFYAWLRTVDVTESVITEHTRIAGRSVYLIPACYEPDEIDEVVADLNEEIFQRELARWQRDEAAWPDTGDFDLFSRWFTVDGYSLVEDIGRGNITQESLRWQ